jgi:hypothetical protein
MCFTLKLPKIPFSLENVWNLIAQSLKSLLMQGEGAGRESREYEERDATL